MTMQTITISRDSKVFFTLLEYNVACTTNEGDTIWHCIDDGQQPFEIACFASTPNMVTIYPVTL